MTHNSSVGRQCLLVEASCFGLAYAAGLCWITVCLLASFRPNGLSAAYWTELPYLRSDTSGVIAFFAVSIFLPCSEFLRLRRRPRIRRPSGWLPFSDITTAAGLAISETLSSLSTGLVLYLSVNAVTHPATMTIRATHIAPWPTESTLRAIALITCALSATVYRLFSATRRS